MTPPRPARILIVDDEAAQMKALCDTLHSQGYVTTGFSSPRDAVEAMATQRFDLLLTDLEMAGMNGIELLRTARDLDAEIIGIMMTGHATVDTAVEAMKAGAFDYILKPFKLSTILPVLARALVVRQLRLDNADLVRRVDQRTTELEIVNRELEAFSYSVAHDLRAPLRAINGFSAMLLEDFATSLPTRAQELLRRVAANAGHMGQLIEALLRLSRLGRQPLSLDTVRMADLVALVLSDLRKDTDGRRLELHIAELPDTVGDRDLLKQLLVNLLSNAAKFTRDRDPAIITIGAEQGEQETIYFVKDNGVGFDLQFAERLFGVFQRFHAADAFEGTGVGLSIVQRIVHRHGGRIWAEARVDQGATFFFALPREPALARTGSP